MEEYKHFTQAHKRETRVHTEIHFSLKAEFKIVKISTLLI